jgi:outer membrane receptor protein involved in Fe transport
MRYSPSLGALAAALVAVPAAAQAVSPQSVPATPAAEESPDRAKSDDQSRSDIVVTGSRIARRDYSADSPIVTVRDDQLKSSGQPTVEASLNQLPQFTASASGATSGAGAQNRGGQATANLRGLGQQRTLVLLDGRRLQPGGSDGAVDLNTLPDALIENVEVITGGASATYGSDAIAGVVNFKLRHHFTGLQVDAQNGITDRGDGGTRNVSVTGGLDFDGGKGNVVLSGSFADRDPVLNPARGFFRYSKLAAALPEGNIAVNANNLPSQAAVDIVFARYGIAPGRVSRSLAFSFNNDGSLFAANPVFNYRDPPDHVLNDGKSVQYSTGDFGYLQLPLTRYSAFGRVEYAFSDNLHAFLQGQYTHYKAIWGIAPPVIGGGGTAPVTVPVTNPFIPADLAALLASRPNPTAPFSLTNKRTNETGNRLETDQYDVFQITGGLSGKLAGDWTWDVSGSFGRSKAVITDAGYPSIAALNNLVAAPDGGRTICAGGYNPFGLTQLSAACKQYILRTITNRTNIEQQVLEGNVQGKLLDLPAGEVRAAAGAAYRRNFFEFDPDPQATTAGLVNFSQVKPASGATRVKEVYGELLVPLLHNLPLLQQLTVDLGYRYSDYNLTGGVSTYKADGNWKLGAGFGIRGGYSRAIRAPNAGELFAAASQSAVVLGAIGPLGSGDPCDVRSGYRAPGYSGAAPVRALCITQGVPVSLVDSFRNTTAQSVINLSGNPNLKEETADTYSVGAVFSPKVSSPWLSRLNLSVDFYSISLKDAIGTITGPVAVAKCFNADGSNPTYGTDNIYCAAIVRQAGSGLIETINTPLLNLGGYRTSGIDFTADWAVPTTALGLGGRGSLRLNTAVSYLRSFKIQNLPGAPFQEFGGTILNTQIDPLADAHPRWKATTSFGYETGGSGLTFRWRFIDKMTNANNVGTTGTAPGVKAVSYFDLDARIKVNDVLTLRAGVTNLTDVPAPLVGNVVGQTDYATYDVLGRRLYFGARVKF